MLLPNSLTPFEVLMFRDDILPPEKEEMRIWAATAGSVCLQAGPHGKQSRGRSPLPPFFSSNPLKITADPTSGLQHIFHLVRGLCEVGKDLRACTLCRGLKCPAGFFFPSKGDFSKTIIRGLKEKSC